MKIRKKVGSQICITNGAEDNSPNVFVVRSTRRKEKVFLIQEGKNPPVYLSAETMESILKWGSKE
jgi:hypothetical protein